MWPWVFCSLALVACASGSDPAGRVKSSPTSYPLTVSSQVIHEPHGIRPPEQFIWVPARLANEYSTSPWSVRCTVDVPPSALLS